MREEAPILKQIVTDLLNIYKRGKNRLITDEPRYLELKRFKSFPSVIERCLQLRNTLSTFALRRQMSLKSEKLAELMLTSVFIEYMAQKASVKRDEKGLRQWVLPEHHEEVEDIVDQFFRYLYDGVEVVRVGFDYRHSPFSVIRPVGTTPSRITLVDDITMDCFGYIFIEDIVSAPQPIETSLQGFSKRLQDFLFAMSIAFPGHVRLRKPIRLRGRAWQPRTLHSFEALASEFFPGSQMQFQPTNRRTTLDFASGTIMHIYVPDDLEAARKAYLLTTTNFVRLDEKTRNTFLRAWHRKLLAAERQWQQDRLIDYIIALETLLNTGDELRFRTSLYTCAALGTTPEDKEKIFRIVYRAYSYRNNIVHGKETDEVGEIVDECEHIVCSLLLKFLEWAKPVPQVQEMLQQKVIRGQ